jgi:23S rRNA pseudouridine1911/1915/1917 synthase
VHRLDRETSGDALYARDAAAAARAGSAFARGAVVRRYLAHVAPPPPQQRVEVTGWMGRAADPARFRFALHDAPGPGRRPSHTAFRRLSVYGSGALIEALPETGRTHQIRVHLARAGSPVRGDAIYGNAAAAPRCLLHAAFLALPELRLEAEAPPPADFSGASGTQAEAAPGDAHRGGVSPDR